MKSTPGFTDGRSILCTLDKMFERLKGDFVSVSIPSSILRTSSRLFMTEDMKLVQSCMPAIRDLAVSGRSSGMLFRAESIALKGLLCGAITTEDHVSEICLQEIL